MRIHPAVVTEDIVLLISPGPALTPDLVLDISTLLLRGIISVVLVNCHYPAENLTLFIVGEQGDLSGHLSEDPCVDSQACIDDKLVLTYSNQTAGS